MNANELYALALDARKVACAKVAAAFLALREASDTAYGKPAHTEAVAAYGRARDVFEATNVLVRSARAEAVIADAATYAKYVVTNKTIESYAAVQAARAVAQVAAQTAYYIAFDEYLTNHENGGGNIND